MTRLRHCAAPIDIHVEVPYDSTARSVAVIACRGDVVRDVTDGITANQPGVAVAVRSYRLADAGSR